MTNITEELQKLKELAENLRHNASPEQRQTIKLKAQALTNITTNIDKIIEQPNEIMKNIMVICADDQVLPVAIASIVPQLLKYIAICGDQDRLIEILDKFLGELNAEVDEAFKPFNSIPRS